MPEWTLSPGERIKRGELHHLFGGSRQSGISPSVKTPNVFLFTSSAKAQTGYLNNWQSDGCFHYTGEGQRQRGDQQALSGNRAILDASNAGRVLRVFAGFGGNVEYGASFPWILSSRSIERRPEAIHDLSPRQFEELVADLLSDMGCETMLTLRTRDGGKDILAYLDTCVGRALCLVETKKYRPDRPVGVDLVRALYGTLCDHGATSAMLVTTSSFTSGAREWQRRHSYRLCLREYADLVTWLQHYGERRGRRLL
jgi:hypothetical protein